MGFPIEHYLMLIVGEKPTGIYPRRPIEYYLMLLTDEAPPDDGSLYPNKPLEYYLEILSARLGTRPFFFAISDFPKLTMVFNDSADQSEAGLFSIEDGFLYYEGTLNLIREDDYLYLEG